jgi:rhamnogalacturonyl hydrolase YesR
MIISLKRLATITFLIIPVCFTEMIRAQEVPSAQTLEALAEISSSYGSQSKNLSNKWPYSEYFRGLYAYYKISSDSASMDKLLSWGKSNSWDLPDGKSTRNAFDMNCGQTYIEMYILDRYKEERIRNIRACADNLLKEKPSEINSVGELSMILPILAGLGTIYNNDKYYQKMEAFFMNLRDTLHLYNREEHLWMSEENGSEQFKAEDNGHILAALFQTLGSLSSGRYKKDYEMMLKEMAETLVPLQRNDGYWNVSLSDTTKIKTNDLLATTMIIYGISGGVNNGILDRKDFQPILTKSWESIISGLVRSDGTVAFPSIKDDQLARLTGSLLMAGSEMYTLQKSVEPKVKAKKVKEEDEKKKPEGRTNVKAEGHAKQRKGDKKSN